VFEHGTGQSAGRVLCTVDHAHTHFVPLPATASDPAFDETEWLPFDGTLRTLATLTAGCEYVVYEPPGGTARVRLAASGAVESQHMRKVLAQCLGKGDAWNWRTAPRARVTHATWQRCVASAAKTGS
jgi:hypothetical protein